MLFIPSICPLSWNNYRVSTINNNLTVFLALLRAGLWEKDIHLLPFGKIDFADIYQLADDQSVVGLVAAGLEHVKDVKVVKADALRFLKKVYSLEQRNQGMNKFLGQIVQKMRDYGVHTVLVKGQGVAQYYERPQWRSSGDIDFFLSKENYERAKKVLTPLASHVDEELVREKHLGMTIDSWKLELHGSLYCGLSSEIEKELDEIKSETFIGKNVRSCQIGNLTVFLLATENEAFYVFTHILQHFYKGGIGLRQICDWCRLLWTHRSSLDVGLLESRLQRAGLMSEWKAFGTFAVEYLGMPSEAMPFHDPSMRDNVRLKKQAERIKDFVMMSGNFGQNRDMSYYHKYPYMIRKVISFGRRLGDLYRHAMIFPMDSLRFMPRIVFNGVCSALRKE